AGPRIKLHQLFRRMNCSQESFAKYKMRRTINWCATEFRTLKHQRTGRRKNRKPVLRIHRICIKRNHVCTRTLWNRREVPLDFRYCGKAIWLNHSERAGVKRVLKSPFLAKHRDPSGIEVERIVSLGPTPVFQPILLRKQIFWNPARKEGRSWRRWRRTAVAPGCRRCNCRPPTDPTPRPAGPAPCSGRRYPAPPACRSSISRR
ncbi:MAG: hypothetical protein JWM11_3628, partial [Planctomycetaceae bacterium]|nr:hypothetical protein [Planctomycetaceae bacterium]